MKHLFDNSISRLRTIGFLEAVSFLALLGIAMPLKYLAGHPEMVKYVGLVHGLLFIAYVFAAIAASAEHQWSRGRMAAVLVASLLPFGPFVVDAKLLRRTPEAG